VSDRSASCLARIPDSSLVPAVLYLHASEMIDLDSTARLRVKEIDLFAQSVSERLRSLLHAGPGKLPVGEPVITWRTRERALRIIVDRDGRFVTRPPPSMREGPDLPGTIERSRLLAAAVDSLRADGELLAFTAGPADSVAFDLLLSPGTFGEFGKPTPPVMRVGFAVAALLMPVEDTVRVIDLPAPAYPLSQWRQGIEAVVILEFVVDTAGRADRATIRAVPAAGLVAESYKQQAFEAFVNAARAAVERGQFEPARVGGCAVRQQVRLPFNFGRRR
jgi:TonB family protein